jgi:hypothetical protein
MIELGLNGRRSLVQQVDCIGRLVHLQFEARDTLFEFDSLWVWEMIRGETWRLDRGTSMHANEF